MRSYLANLFRPKTPKVSLPPVYRRLPVEEWTESDVTALRSFLMSPFGQKLLRRARSMEAATSVTACGDAFQTSHSAGRAAGFGDALNWLESLTQISRGTGAQVLTEVSIGSQESEAELIGRLSP